MSALESACNSSKSEDISAGAGAPELDLPRRFGRLTLLRQIARGGMGEVYLATSGGIEGAERPCVVKLIRREHQDDKSFLARFLDEARIQSQLHHPGVAQVLEAANDDEDRPYVIVEHVEGRNLGEVRQRAVQLGVRVGWAEAVALGVMLGEALAHIHERTDPSGRPLEIAHRDLSPQNVMIGYSGDCKLIDFGTAKGENRRCHTVAGIVFAKPGYVAPEVANNTPGGPPADLYAFGVMLWELCAGRRFLVGEAAEHMAAVGAGLRNLASLAPAGHCPAELDVIFEKLTATRIADRYPSARAAVAALGAVMKTAPSLADGERSVRYRVAHLMQRLYPAEPARSRSEFARLVASARKVAPPRALSVPPSPPPAPVAADDPGLFAGTRYRLVRELGRGASGDVHEALHVDLGRRVALKVLGVEHAGNGELSGRFRAEARAIADLDHPGIIRVIDFGIAGDGRPFLAMELVEGETLDRVLAREQCLDWREVARIGAQVCAALEVAHRAGVIHRDLKPQNLMLTRTGAVKLLDFGLAAVRARAHDPVDPERALELIGTPEYVAPEVARGADGDERSDLYSLGVVLYELCTGALPITAPSTVALLDLKTRTVPPSPALRAPERGIPTMLSETVSRSIDTDPQMRFESAAEMRAALDAALREPDSRRARRRKIGFSALGIVAIALAGMIGVGVKSHEARERAAAIFQPVLSRLRGAPPVAAPAAAAVADLEGDDGTTDDGADPAEPAQGAAATEPATGEAKAGETDDKLAAAPAAANTPTAAADEKADEAVGDPAIAADDKEDDKDEAAAAPGAPPSSEPVTTADNTAKADTKGGKESAVDLEAQMAEASALVAKGARIKGFHMMRKIGKSHRKDAQVLKAWTEMAASLHSWGEALRVARQWASVAPGTESELHLARMQRAVGKPKEAQATLAKIVQQHPECEDAKAMLRLYDERRVALRR